ncbi:cold-shock protein [Chloroflexota bacterium]
MENGEPAIQHGVIRRKEHSFAFIVRDGLRDSIFVHSVDIDDSLWEILKEGNRVRFLMGFSYKGPRGFDVRKE